MGTSHHDRAAQSRVPANRLSGKIWKVLVNAEKFAQEMFPGLHNPR
jgi:hypothetical protein